MTYKKGTFAVRVPAVLIAILVVFGMTPMFGGEAYAATKKPGKTMIKSLSLDTNSQFTVKWKKAKRAAKYQVYVKKGAAKWKKVKTTKARSYKMKAAYSTKYSFKVRAIKGKKKGKFSAVVSMKTYDKPKATTKSETSSGSKETSSGSTETSSGDTRTGSGGAGTSTGGQGDSTSKDAQVTPSISLVEIKRNEMREYPDGSKRLSATIQVEVVGGLGKTLIWYKVPKADSYAGAEEYWNSPNAISVNKGYKATLFIPEKAIERYFYCSFIDSSGKEVKSKIFTISAQN